MIRILAVILAFALCVAPLLAQKQAPGDGEIHDQVLIRLAGDRDVKGTGISCDVKDGVVTLTGKVENDKIRKKAEGLTKKVKGVKAVVNQLAVGPK
jgi:osmotically-inducible protein OsmY